MINTVKYFLVIALLSMIKMANGQYQSPFNQHEIALIDSNGYHFIVSGHFYGNRHNISNMPTNTLMANLDWINESKANMLVCLGDLFKDIRNDKENYQTYLFDRLGLPLVNTVGNHDLSGDVYQDNYGETAFYFELNGDVHLILDSERDNGDIIDEQMELLKEVAQKAKDAACKNVFIYAHRTIWSDNYEALDGLFTDNTQSIGGTNFGKEVHPILQEMGKNANIYWFAGSLGTAPASFFHFEDQASNLTFIATAIRGHRRDAVLMVNVSEDGQVSFETNSFTGQELLKLEEYDVSFWKNEVGEEPINWKLIPYYIELMLTHRYFWYGVGSALFGFFILLVLKKRREKNKLKRA